MTREREIVPVRRRMLAKRLTVYAALGYQMRAIA